MIPLNDDHSVFHGAAGAAAALDPGGQRFEVSLAAGQPGYGGNAFALAALGFAANSNDAVDGGIVGWT